MSEHQSQDRLITLEEVEKARRRISGMVMRTPTVHARRLSDITGADLFLKHEHMHYTASFKERGACNALQVLREGEDPPARVVAMSAGNHAQALARYASILGFHATIVMPISTPLTKVQRTRMLGAEIVLEGETLDDAAGAVDRFVEDHGAHLVHPFQDPDVCAGQGTCALELLEDVDTDLDALVIPVGGGGLLAGCAAAAKAKNPDIVIYGVESEMYPSLADALAQRPFKSGGYTIAEGIAIKRAGSFGLAAARHHRVTPLQVSEDALERAVALLANEEKTVTEGAGAAGVAAILDRPDLFKGRRVGIPLCGGNIDARLLSSVLMRDLARDKRLVLLRVAAQDAPGQLSRVTDLIGNAGGNIMEVQHDRLALDVPAKGTVFDILLETRDSRHIDEIVGVLSQAGYAPRLSEAEG